MKAAELLVRALENEGVKFIFGVPGEENLDFLDALSRSAIKFVITRHEQGAGFMAATYGRLTGKTGVCLSTLGPGATNLMTAAAYAHLGGMPMLMITGQKPIKRSKQGQFQIVQTVEMLKPLTKFTKQIVNGDSIPMLVRQSFRLAEEERPGATHLELPEDVASEETTAELFTVSPARRPVPDAKAIKKALEMIEAARHPLILVGAGGNRKLVSKMLKLFIEKTHIPFFNTQMGKGVVDERHSEYLGTAALSSHDAVHCAIERADLIINIGHDVVEKPPFIMKAGGAKVIHINFYSAHIDEVYFPQLEVIGDIGNALWQIEQTVRPPTHWDFSYFLEIKKQFEASLAKISADDDFPLRPQRVVTDVRAVVPNDGIIALDNGMYKIWFARNYKAYAPNTILLDNALATMGAGLPAAIATKLVFPDKKVLAVVGDGGFMMSVQELETAVRLNLDLVILILNDSGFGMIKWKQTGMGYKNFGLEFGNPDFVKLAESFGARGHRIEKAEDLRSVLDLCLNGNGVHLVEVPINYSDYSQLNNVCQFNP
ncbi:MAG: acetolactate synthase large subunit [Patescibacteria group bacterium]